MTSELKSKENHSSLTYFQSSLKKILQKMKRLHAEAHMQVGTEELIRTQGKTQRIENIFCFQLQLAVPHL